MADLRIVDAPLLSTVKGTEKIPTGGEGNFSVSVNQVADFAKLKWFLATEEYVDNAVGNVQDDLNLHKNNSSNPHGVTKVQVGLGNVDNTADVDKPIGSATQAALVTLTQTKADKTYVDAQLNSKADKATTYTKTETDSLVSAKSDTTYVNTKYSSHIKTFLNTGTALSNTVNGEYFFVISNDSEKVEDLYLNVNGVATNQNKSEISSLLQHNSILGRDVTGAHQATSISTASGVNQQQINDFGGAKWYAKVGGYNLGATVRLDNGDIVKSTVAANTVNPNVDMSGWELVENSIFVPSVTKLLTMKPKENKLYNVHSYHDGGQRGGSDLIAIQSSILIENGVTVFRSNVVGFEDYFWVRVNISHITPEMAGAIGDKTYNCCDAFQKCFNVGGDLRLNENSKYLVYGDDITAHRDTYILKCTKPISITCAGKASVYFKHDVVTGSPTSIIFEGVSENLASLKMEGVDWYGHETEGHANKVNRAWGIGLRGVDNFNIKRCKFSTFQGHCPNISRRTYENNGDWIQSSDLNQANTSEAINRLMSLSSKNGVIENIQIRHAGSTGLAFFGADQVSVDGVDADMTGAGYDFSVWTDDASSQTALKDYALNRGISIKNVKGGSIDLTGCTTATVTGCNVKSIGVRAYDFDQQKNNFDSGTHTYNIDDHLNAPFLWMQNGGFVRRISIYSNSLNKLDIRSIFVDAYKNSFYSRSDGYEFITCDKNGILWGNGSTYADEYTSFSAGVKNNVTANTFILNHTNCVCVTYGAASPNSYINATESIIEKTNPAFVYTHMRNVNQYYRRDSYYDTGANDGYTLSKTINHHIEIKQGLLTQGVGSNHLKTFVNIFGSASGGQTIANFKNTTTPVYFFVNLIDIAGRLFRKKIVVAVDNTITVSDLDSQTIYNVSFSVTVTSGVVELKITSAGNDLCLDIIGIGSKGNCVFLVPKERLISAG